MKINNMREIKFRAWDKGKKIFLPQDSFAVLTDHYAGPLFVMVKDFENYRDGEFGYQNDFELMQYTGLKDKNGVEIYEGDILDFHNGYIQVIHFYDGCFRLKDNPYQSNYEHGLVIGNVYQNPELLNNKDN